jgi:hypothetical protein
MVGSDVYICYKKSMNRADLISYRPSLLSRYPLKNNPFYALEETVALFCLPMGATLECWPSNSARTASVTSSFVLTLANRNKVYGSAITFYEEYPETEITAEQNESLQLHKYRSPKDRQIFSNKCICILSRWPFFEAFESFLFFLHKRQLMGPHDVPLERFISHFLYDVPFPSPSRPRILLQLSPEERIALFQPEELPLPRSGASFRNLLTNLGPENCLLVLLLVLTEQKILLHSLRPDVLTSVAEATMQIIFPFYWQCPYVPLCPIGLSDYLSAPMAFIMGLDSRFFDLYDQPSDVNAIDLDTSTVTLCEEKKALTSKLLPKKAAKRLKAKLAQLEDKCTHHRRQARKLEAQDDGAIDFEFKRKRTEMQLEMEIREAFLHFMVSVLTGYRHFLLPITSAPADDATDVGKLFDQTNFLRSRDRNFHRFYVMLMKTQMFAKFIEERSFVSDTNAYHAFFDECVDRLQMVLMNDHDPEKLSFLELEVSDSDRTVFILPPDISDLEEKENKAMPAEYKYETFELSPSLFPPERELDSDFEQQNVDGGGTAAAAAASGANGFDDDSWGIAPILSTPGITSSALAKRTKQEIRSAQKIARRHVRTPYLWAKCLINTSYSLWFIHLPGYVLANDGKPQTLRIGLALLQRMQRLRLHPADEICYRVMMQLCGVYDQPILAVKVLCEMKTVNMHPNAVTYGHYNKAVLESTWPTTTGKDTPAVIMWNKLRNVLRAMSAFKFFGKYGGLKVTVKIQKPDGDTVSQASSSEESGVKAPKQHNESVATEDKKTEETVPAEGEEVEVAAVQQQFKQQFQRRLQSIVKLVNFDGSDEQDAGEEAGDGHEGAAGGDSGRPDAIDEYLEKTCDEEDDDDGENGSGPEVKRRLKFDSPAIQPEVTLNSNAASCPSVDDLGVSSLDGNHTPKLATSTTDAASAVAKRSLFGDDEDEKDGKDVVVSQLNGNSVASSKESVSASNNSLESAGSSTAGRSFAPGGLEIPFSGSLHGLQKVASTSSMRLPVTECDPLGALESPPSSDTPTIMTSTMTKSATCPVDIDENRTPTPSNKVDDNILGKVKLTYTNRQLCFIGFYSVGTPFSEMGRSSTLPSNSSSSLSSSFSSFKNLTKSGIGNRLTGFKKSYLSPGPATYEKTQKAMSSMKSAYSSAATVVSKRVDEIRESMPVPTTPGMTPATSQQYLSTPSDGRKEEDANSTTSTDSRRPSIANYDYVNDQSETWSSLTGQIWDQLWGVGGGNELGASALAKSQAIPRASDVCEQFESLYGKMPKRPAGPVAMELQMTTCTQCRYCRAILYDEEIMSGWTAEDSDLNTKCQFCDNKVVPILTTKAIDFRTTGPMEAEADKREGAPRVSGDITVPYLSPLVLRKELENLLDTEGDQSLLEPSGVDSHPIIFWNLIWYYERIAVKSYLVGHCLKAASLNSHKIHPSWSGCDHRNIHFKCRWDNERFFDEVEPPLYTVWKRHQHSRTSSSEGGDIKVESPKEVLVLTEKQDPAYKALMQHVVAGVQRNDLLQVKILYFLLLQAVI